MNKENSIWITDLKEIPSANEQSLRRSLITLDGRGEEIKAAALDELLRRAEKDGYSLCLAEEYLREKETP